MSIITKLEAELSELMKHLSMSERAQVESEVLHVRTPAGSVLKVRQLKEKIGVLKASHSVAEMSNVIRDKIQR